MELNFFYNIYIQKDKLEKTLRYLHKHCDAQLTDFEFQGNNMFHVERSSVGDVKTKIELYKPEKLNCTVIVENDEIITSYYLNYLSERYEPNSENEENYFDYWLTDKKHIRVGNIEIYISDYSDKIENTFELSFVAVTSNMSVLFAESESINKFFKNLCLEIKADHAYLYKEEYGIQILFLDKKEVNYTIPIYWDSLQIYGVIPVIRDILRLNQ